MLKSQFLETLNPPPPYGKVNPKSFKFKRIRAKSMYLYERFQIKHILLILVCQFYVFRTSGGHLPRPSSRWSHVLCPLSWMLRCPKVNIIIIDLSRSELNINKIILVRNYCCKNTIQIVDLGSFLLSSEGCFFKTKPLMTNINSTML